MSRTLFGAALALVLGCTYHPPAASGESLLPGCPAGQTVVGADGGRWTCFDPAGVHLAHVSNADTADSASYAAHADTAHHAEQAREVDGVEAPSLVLGDEGAALQGEALEVSGSQAITSGGVVPVGLAGVVADAGAGPGTSLDTWDLQSVGFTLPRGGQIHVFAHGALLGGDAGTSNWCQLFLVVKPNPLGPCGGDGGDTCPLDQPQQAGGDVKTALGPAPFSLMSSAHLPAGSFIVTLEATTQSTVPPSSCILSQPATLDVELN